MRKAPGRTRSTSAMQIPLPRRTTPSRSGASFRPLPPGTALPLIFPQASAGRAGKRHAHQSFGQRSADGTDVMPQVMAGILARAYELSVFLNPLESSYRRFGCRKAPRYISWSSENRSQLIRIPAASGEYRRAELRSPDPSCNPHLAFCASDLRRARRHPVQASPARTCRCEPVHRARERDVPVPDAAGKSRRGKTGGKKQRICRGAASEAPA